MNSTSQLQTLCLTTDQFADLLIADDTNLLSFASRKRHLQQCAACHAEYRRLELLLGGLRVSATVQSAAAQRKAKVLHEVPRSHGTRHAVWSFATAALAVVVALPFALHQRAAQPMNPVSAENARPAVQADATPTISDEALLDGISQDLSASVPSSLAPLSNPSNASTSTDSVTRP